MPGYVADTNVYVMAANDPQSAIDLRRSSETTGHSS
jgi:hypothetical protein